PFAAMLRVLTDSELTCPVRAFARKSSTGGRAVYRYFFTHAVENQRVIHQLGAFDNVDNWFRFRVAPYTLTINEQALTDVMRAYWASFAATGNPNGGDRIAWPVYEHTHRSDNYLSIDTTMIAGNGVRTMHCDLWNALDRKTHGEP